MTKIYLTCIGATARVRVEGAVTAGMVGIPVEIRCDSSWDGLSKTLVCMSGNQKIPQLVVPGQELTVAWEVLQQGLHLYLGLEGRDGSGSLVIPTTWADCGRVQPGAGGSHTETPTPGEMEQLLNAVLEARDQTQALREHLKALVPTETETSVPVTIHKGRMDIIDGQIIASNSSSWAYTQFIPMDPELEYTVTTTNGFKSIIWAVDVSGTELTFRNMTDFGVPQVTAAEKRVTSQGGLYTHMVVRIRNADNTLFYPEEGQQSVFVTAIKKVQVWEQVQQNTQTLEALKDTPGRKEQDWYLSMALFERVGVIGDSYASGSCAENPGDAKAVMHKSVSWPAILGRRNGIEVRNYSAGGLSTSTWLTNSQVGYSALMADIAAGIDCGLYILALERNDYNLDKDHESDSDPARRAHLGSAGDAAITSAASPGSFWANYRFLIRRLKAAAPKAVIVLMAGDYASGLGAEYNEAMRRLAEAENVAFIAQRDDAFFLDKTYYLKDSGGHPAAIVYSGMALAIERLIQKAAMEQREHFVHYNGLSGGTGEPVSDGV